MAAKIGVSHALEIVHPKQLLIINDTPTSALTTKVRYIFSRVFITGIFLISFKTGGKGPLSVLSMLLDLNCEKCLKKHVLIVLYEMK